MRVPQDLHYYVGEKPDPLPCEYVDKDGDLIADISGATLTAKCSINEGTAVDVPCTNNGDGTFTINWSTVTSNFTAAGWMRILIEVDQTPKLWYMDPEMIEIRTV